MDADQPALTADNRGYRYGDGLFETMKIMNGKILLESFHFERLLTGMKLMKMEEPESSSVSQLKNEILLLCRENKCEDMARVRLSISRGKGGIYDFNNQLNYLIESWPLENKINEFNEKGLVIDIFPDARKNCDKFSNLKSANYLSYVMAAIWAKEHQLDDALILNQHQRICDATIANVFWVKGQNIFTPPLTEGCVAGVMRRWILDCGFKISDLGLKLTEKTLTDDDLLVADEVFLTNTTSGIRWVKQFRKKIYTHVVIGKMHNIIKTP